MNGDINTTEIPDGWMTTRLDQIGTWSTGGTPSRKNPEYFGDGIPWVKSGDLSDGIVARTEEAITQQGLDSSAARLLPAGSLMIALYGATIGKLGILDMVAATNQACAGCQINLEIAEPWFVFYYLRSQRQELIKAGQGGAQPNLTNAIVRQWPIPLPPLAEQRRIVERLEVLLARVQTARQRLTRVPQLLKRFRQAILTAACNGQLTADWREWQTLGATGSSVLQNVVLLLAEDTPDISLPVEWRWVPTKSLCEDDRAITYGVIKLGPHVDEGVPTLRSSDVRALFIDRGSIKQIAQEIANQYSRTYLKGGEVLVTVRGTLGGVAVVPPDMAGYNISREVAQLPLIKSLNPTFVMYAIASTMSQNWLTERAKGVAYTGINIADLRCLPLPLPPLAEQHEIVRRVNALFQLADAIERRVTAATAKSDKLTQAILAKAFRGELVPTEADLARTEGRDYETAEQLLLRVQNGQSKIRSTASRRSSKK